jgi:CRP/FNR family transcriptional regulator
MTTITPHCLTCNANDCLLKKKCEPTLLNAIDRFKHHYLIVKGETLFREGDPIRGVHFIRSGVFKLELNSPKGKAFILRLSGTGDTLGYRYLNHSGLQPYSAIAVEDSKVCFIELDFFNSLLKKSDTLQQEIHKSFLVELRKTELRLLHIVHQSVKEKVAEVLLHLADIYEYEHNGKGIHIQLDRQEMADLAGTTKEQVSKILAEFHSQKLVHHRAKHIKTMDLDGLKRITESVN